MNLLLTLFFGSLAVLNIAMGTGTVSAMLTIPLVFATVWFLTETFIKGIK